MCSVMRSLFLVKILKVKGVIASEAWQSHKKDAFFSKRLPSLFRAERRNPFPPRNDTKLRLLHSDRNDSRKVLLIYWRIQQAFFSFSSPVFSPS